MTLLRAAIRRNVANCQFKESLLTFCQMRRIGSHVGHLALAATAKSCAMISDVGLGESLHGFVTKSGYCAIIAVKKALMDMYARFNMMRESIQLFKEMGWRDSVSWNILMSGFTRLEFHREAMDLFHTMHIDKEVVPNAVSIAIILPSCTKMRALASAKNIHGYSIKTGLLSETLVGNGLVSMYAKFGSLRDCARRVFDLIDSKDVISWNSMITAYAENGSFEESLSLFSQMVSLGFCPNNFTIASVLPLCSSSPKVCHWGKVIHCYMLRFQFETDTSVSNALMAYYARTGDMRSVDYVFRNMHPKDVVSWNTVIAGYGMNGLYFTALKLFREMVTKGMMPDSVAVASVLRICAQLRNILAGREIHAYVSKEPDLSKDTCVSNALVSFYGKCKELGHALQMFVSIPKKDLISWNAMLSTFVDNEKWEDLIGFLKKMLENRVKPDHVSILSVLQACASLSLLMVREVHGHIVRSGYIGTLTIGNALIDAYAKSGSIDNALRVFESLSGCNIISFNAMIAAFMSHGFRKEAVAVFDKMEERDIGTWNLVVQLYAQNYDFSESLHFFLELQQRGLRPDSASIMIIIPVCACLASVNLVKQCHSYALRNHLDDLHVRGAFVDTYSKCGSINYAYKLFERNVQNDIVTFTAMIGGFARNGMAKEALGLFYQMLEQNVKPDHVVMAILLFACGHAGLLDEGWKLFKSIEITYGIKLTMKHYSCIIDLFARSGCFKEAYTLLASMPHEVNANILGAILGASKIHGELEIAQLAAEQLFKIEAENIGNYVVMSNVYASKERWDDVENVRGLIKTRELRKPAGCSWIEVEKTRHTFIVGDMVHPERVPIYTMVNNLSKEIKEAQYYDCEIDSEHMALSI